MTIYDWLNEKGYIGPVTDLFQQHTVYFHKKVPHTYHQWEVSELKFNFPNVSRCHGFEVKMTYETFDHTWAQIKFYSINEEDLKKNLDSYEKRLVAAIVPMGGNPLDYQANVLEDK